MANWDEDVAKYCNEIYQYSDNISEAESILDAILKNNQEYVRSTLSNSFGKNNELYLAVSYLNQMQNQTRDCLVEKDACIRSFTLSLELIVYGIISQKRIEALEEEELFLDDVELEMTNSQNRHAEQIVNETSNSWKDQVNSEVKSDSVLFSKSN